MRLEAPRRAVPPPSWCARLRGAAQRLGVSTRVPVPSTGGGSAVRVVARHCLPEQAPARDRKSTRLNSSHITISYAVFCLKKKKQRANDAIDNRGAKPVRRRRVPEVRGVGGRTAPTRPLRACSQQ